MKHLLIIYKLKLNCLSPGRLNGPERKTIKKKKCQWSILVSQAFSQNFFLLLLLLFNQWSVAGQFSLCVSYHRELAVWLCTGLKCRTANQSAANYIETHVCRSGTACNEHVYPADRNPLFLTDHSQASRMCFIDDLWRISWNEIK